MKTLKPILLAWLLACSTPAWAQQATATPAGAVDAEKAGLIRELLALSSHPEKPCDRADRIAADHLATVREKIARLRKLESELERIVSHCEGHTIGDCYVIRALSDHGLCTGDHESA